MGDIKKALTVLLPVVLLSLLVCILLLIARLFAPKKGVIEGRLRKKRESGAAFVNTLEDDGPLRKLEKKLSQADVGIGVAAYLGMVLAASVMIYLIVSYLTDAKGAGLIVALAGVFVPDYIVGVLKRRRSDEFDTMFMKALKRMSGNLRAESSLEQAMEDVAGATGLPETVRREFRICLSDYRYHADMKKAFLSMYERTGDRDVKSVALAVAISERYGSSLSEIFDSYAETISKRKIMEANARAELSSTRTDTVIACSAPFLFGAAMKVMQPDYFDAAYAWMGGAGKYILILLYAMVAGGFMFLMKKCSVRLNE